MLVLGLRPWMKNTSAALVEDGKLLFGAEEERFTGYRMLFINPHGLFGAKC
tara:strand:+ start:466 stop:618 length:153 start_codon:yes stop_codon:yes gene_type:complete